MQPSAVPKKKKTTDQMVELHCLQIASVTGHRDRCRTHLPMRLLALAQGELVVHVWADLSGRVAGGDLQAVRRRNRHQNHRRATGPSLARVRAMVESGQHRMGRRQPHAWRPTRAGRDGAMLNPLELRDVLSGRE